MYKVKLLQRISQKGASSSLKSFYIHKIIDMPIIPYKGLNMKDGDFLSAKCMGVTYDIKSQILTCHLEPDRACCDETIFALDEEEKEEYLEYSKVKSVELGWSLGL